MPFVLFWWCFLVGTYITPGGNCSQEKKNAQKKFLICQKWVNLCNKFLSAAKVLKYRVLFQKYCLLLIKVKFIQLWHVDNFLLWGFFKFIATKEPNSGNFTHIFSRSNCSEKIFAQNFRCWTLILRWIWRNPKAESDRPVKVFKKLL